MTRDCCFCHCFYSFIYTPKKTSAMEPRKDKVVGTWSIFKKEKSRRIWRPCERTLPIPLFDLHWIVTLLALPIPTPLPSLV